MNRLAADPGREEQFGPHATGIIWFSYSGGVLVSSNKPICDADDLHNESDVEQKFIYPLLTRPQPQGLGYTSADIRTKAHITRMPIGKGDGRKSYYPDYLIVLSGYPIIVIEAKEPGDDLGIALHEARLYATELNAAWPGGINPCVRLIATNGLGLISAPFDQASPDISLTLAECEPTNIKFDALLRAASREFAREVETALHRVHVLRPLHRALKLLGGQSIRDEQIGYNSFGRNLSLDYSGIFNPISRAERAQIVRNAYVTSTRRKHYVDEIDRIIASEVGGRTVNATVLKDTESPAPLIKALGKGTKLENKILLLVGARGSGKSTFVDYFREVKLTEELSKGTAWAYLNLNNSPKDKSMLERWTLEQLNNELRQAHPELDFFTREVAEQVYSVELNRLKAVALAGFSPDSEAYKTRIADALIRLQDDSLLTAKAMTRFLFGEKQRRLLIVVFDNCDKQDRDEQLQAFQIAKWLQSEIRCLVFLPLRDVTYELYRTDPPLDTAIKDMVFRIDAPSFTRILQRRLNLVAQAVKAESNAKTFSFHLPNDMEVHYPKNEIGYYLAGIHRSLYEHDRLIRRLIVGLAGKDIRLAMEIFLEFCKSGHIGAGDVWKMKTNRGEGGLPRHVVTRVLLRRSNRYYDGETSFLKNLFQCEPQDSFPDSFVRVDILRWLQLNFREHGPTGGKGFHPASRLIADLVAVGHDVGRVRAELLYLVKNNCVVTEHQRAILQSDEDLIALSPSGYTHLEMLGDLSYLAACSEETWVESEWLAQTVARRIGGKRPKRHYSLRTTMHNAHDFAEYLFQLAQKRAVKSDKFLKNAFSNVCSDIERITVRVRKSRQEQDKKSGWFDFARRFKVGGVYDGQVQGSAEYGLFVRLADGPKGLVHVETLPADVSLASFRKGDAVRVAILSFSEVDERVSLELDRGPSAPS